MARISSTRGMAAMSDSRPPDFFDPLSAPDAATVPAPADGTDEMVLGSCALRGTSLPIDRRMVARELGFSKVSRNSIDAISDRDFIMEMLSALVITAIHLSRFAEDMILWSTKEFSFVEIDDSHATGSSMMPNKKNPDVLELVRGLSGTIFANLSSVTVMMKGRVVW